MTQADKLKTCPDCGNIVSIRAEACPKCGAPQVPDPPKSSPSAPDHLACDNDKAKSRRKLVVIGLAGAFLVVLVGVAAYFVTLPRDKGQDKNQESAIRAVLSRTDVSGRPTFDATRNGMPLVKLALSHTGNADEALKQLAEIKALGELEELSVNALLPDHSAKITDEGLSGLKEARTLRNLNLSRTNITGAGLVRLSGLTNLETLELSGTMVSDVGLAQLTTLSRLKKLDLSYTPITDAGLVYVKGMTQLTYLNLSRRFDNGNWSGPPLSRRAFSTLSGLAGLEHLHLGGQHEIDVTDIIGFGQLRTLSMGIELGDNQIALISGKLKNHEELHGGWQFVSAAGIAHLCGLKEMRELDLSMCLNLTDNDLAALKDLSKLRSLTLPRTTTAAGRDNLRLTLPKTKIIP